MLALPTVRRAKTSSRMPEIKAKIKTIGSRVKIVRHNKHARTSGNVVTVPSMIIDPNNKSKRILSIFSSVTIYHRSTCTNTICTADKLTKLSTFATWKRLLAFLLIETILPTISLGG